MFQRFGVSAEDERVYVEAVVRTEDGKKHDVRRELVCDFGPGVECDSRLFIDGQPAVDLASVGIPVADSPVRAPVLLQHILRHVLSTEPKQRVGYFKALLSLTDLDALREHVAAARNGAGVERALKSGRVFGVAVAGGAEIADVKRGGVRECGGQY